ncbi:hypothetical protein KAT92_05905 [Candidatus Babeliales bacterium]|nr:hypothetical protein [Candidatus Babeliales bacterium]
MNKTDVMALSDEELNTTVEEVLGNSIMHTNDGPVVFVSGDPLTGRPVRMFAGDIETAMSLWRQLPTPRTIKEYVSVQGVLCASVIWGNDPESCCGFGYFLWAPQEIVSIPSLMARAFVLEKESPTTKGDS